MSRKLTIAKTWDGKPAVAAPYKVSFSINAMTGDVVVNIDAPYFDDPRPPGEPGKYSRLHEYEVVEIFLAAYPSEDDSASLKPYLEVQVGPHGHYNLYFFLEEADFANRDASLELDKLPTPKINSKSGRWSVEVAIPSFFLPEPVCGDDLSVTWMVNAYAIHGVGERREYLAHSPVPGVSPNFHQLATFVPLVLFETLETRQTIDRTSMASERVRASSVAGGYMHSPSTAAAMGLAAGAGRPHEDLTSRLMSDVLKSPGGLKGAGLQDGDEDGGSSGDEDAGAVAKGGSTVFRAGGGSGGAAGSQLGSTSAGDELMHETVAKQIKALGVPLEELDEKFARHLQVSVKQLQKSQGEYSVMHACVTKRKGLSIKSRMLVLTNKARLLYFDMAGEYKGTVPWSVTKPVTASLVSSKKFNVVVFDKSRTYRFTDPQGAERWVTAINLFTKAQKEYLASTMKK